MRIGSLFSGYGGLDMAVQSVYGGDLAWYSEIEPAACTVLAAHHPGVPNLGDITTVDWAQVEPVDILTGGYPCQPFSHAGQRKGKNDERHLYPFVSAAIRTLGPRLVVLENVRGHLSMGLADVIGDLAGLGYDARWGLVSASDAGAPHGRARVFIVAHPAGGGLEERLPRSGQEQEGEFLRRSAPDGGSTAHPHSSGLQGAEHRLDVAAGWGDTGGHVAQGADSAAADAEGVGHERGRRSRERGAGSSHGDVAAPDTERDGRGQARRAAEAQERRASATDRGRDRVPGPVEWGKYEPAIRRWELLTRPAPAPTIHRGSRQRLNPAFVEWMMGLPAGHVTGHGLRPAQELKMLGNGVVPQQAALALRMLAVAR